MPAIDLVSMTNDEIEAYAREQVARCGAPGEDPAGLIMALQNAVAFETACRDPFWVDLLSQDAKQKLDD